jgi:hypothetical protein
MAKKGSRKTAGLVVGKRYEGKYAAFDPSLGQKVIASGRNAGAVVAKARKLGIEVPALIFVPRRDEPLICSSMRIHLLIP